MEKTHKPIINSLCVSACEQSAAGFCVEEHKVQS